MSNVSAKHILVVDDDSGQRSLLREFLGGQGFNVSEAPSGADALTLIFDNPPDMVVTDVRMRGMSGLDLLRRLRESNPVLPVLLITAYADIRDAVGAMRDGAVNYLEKPIDFQEMANCVRQSLGLDQDETRGAAPEMPPLPDSVVAESRAMRKVLEDAALVASSDSRVLITGESGTGKEVVAHLLHQWSRRSTGPMMEVNCAAIPESLLESELFGHEKGAFTGAHKRRFGRFEEARGGTIFLDEIAEMSPALQAKFLRVIQDGTLERVGSSTSISVDVRIIAATNRQLETAVREGRFREDLFYRLSVIELHLPPLRKRPEDILPLAGMFARRYADAEPRFAASVTALLSVYEWPGNVRELQNAMERATLMARGGMILSEHLPPRVRESSPDGGEKPLPESEETGRMEKMERALILQTLREHDYNRTAAASALGISRRALTYKIQRMRDLGYAVDR